MQSTNQLESPVKIDHFTIEQLLVEEEDYFNINQPPKYLSELEIMLSNFLKINQNKKITVVTSGGTTVPLEDNTIRFIDNFSTGTRGAASAEYFLEHGYAVVFIHREFSLLPYSRHFTHTINYFDYIIEDEGQVKIKPQHQEYMLKILRKYKHAQQTGILLLVPFTTITQYLFSLRLIALKMSKEIGNRSLFYLAAAVSDFFIPQSRLSIHKIQSRNDALVIILDPVPKFLKKLVNAWAPNVMIVSFKLETNEKILEAKSCTALKYYGHQLVIGNLLQTRKHEVIFVTHDGTRKISLSDSDIKCGREIEDLIVTEICEFHKKWLKVKC